MPNARDTLCLILIIALLGLARARCPLCPLDSIQCTNILVNSPQSFELTQSSYVHHMHCTYLLDAGDAKFSRVTFNAFDSVRGVDYLRLYDGNNETSSVLFSYSGPGVPFPATFSASQRYLYITWRTSNAIFGTGKGWILQYAQDPGYIKVANNAPKTVYANSWVYLMWNFKGLHPNDDLVFSLSGKDFGALGSAKASDGKINLKVPPYPTVLHYFTFAFTITANRTNTIAYSTTFPYLPSNSYLPNPDNVFVGVYVPNATCLNLGTGVKSLEVVLDESERAAYNVSAVYMKKGRCPTPSDFDDSYSNDPVVPRKELNHVLKEYQNLPRVGASGDILSTTATLPSSLPSVLVESSQEQKESSNGVENSTPSVATASLARFFKAQGTRKVLQQESVAPTEADLNAQSTSDILSVNQPEQEAPAEEYAPSIENQQEISAADETPSQPSAEQVSENESAQVEENVVTPVAEDGMDQEQQQEEAQVQEEVPMADSELQESSVQLASVLALQKVPVDAIESVDTAVVDLAGVRDANTDSPDDIFVTVLLHSDIPTIDSSDFLSMKIGYSANIYPTYHAVDTMLNMTPFEVYLILVICVSVPLCGAIAAAAYFKAWKFPHHLTHGDIIHPGYMKDFFVGIFIGFFFGPLSVVPMLALKSRKFRLGVKMGFGALCFIAGIVMFMRNSLDATPCYTCCKYFGQEISDDTDYQGNPFCYYNPFVSDTLPASPQCYLGETYQNCWTPTAWVQLEIAMGIAMPLFLVGFYILVYVSIEKRTIFLYRPHPGDIEAAEAMKGHHDIQHVSFDKPTGLKYKEGKPTVPSQVVLLDYVKQKEREATYLKKEIISIAQQLKAEQIKAHEISADNQKLKEEQTKQQEEIKKFQEEAQAKQNASEQLAAATNDSAESPTETPASPESLKNRDSAKAKFERALAAFKKYDTDGDGCLTFSEARETLKEITSSAIAESDIANVVGTIGDDAACITIAEIIKILQSQNGGEW